MQYSLTIAGLIGAVALPLIGQLGFSQACSQEVLGVGVPFLLSLPGIVTAAWGRYRQGDITPAGFVRR